MVKNYQSTREEMDSQRLFASLRSPTDNPVRIEDATFVKDLANHVRANKFEYGEVDEDFAGQDYSKSIAPFLKQVIAGAMLLQLIKVTNEYTFESSVKSYSAMGKVVLDLFEVEKLSDISDEDRTNCLQSLDRYLRHFPDAAFHSKKSNADIKAEIAKYAEIEREVVLAGPSN